MTGRFRSGRAADGRRTSQRSSHICKGRFNTDYEPAVWTSNLKVGSDYLVSDGLNKYSVPFDLIGETVNLRLTPNTEVFYRGTRVLCTLPGVTRLCGQQ